MQPPPPPREAGTAGAPPHLPHQHGAQLGVPRAARPKTQRGGRGPRRAQTPETDTLTPLPTDTLLEAQLHPPPRTRCLGADGRTDKHAITRPRPPPPLPPRPSSPSPPGGLPSAASAPRPPAPVEGAGPPSAAHLPGQVAGRWRGPEPWASPCAPHSAPGRPSEALPGAGRWGDRPGRAPD